MLNLSLNISEYQETDEYKYVKIIAYTMVAVSVPGLLANVILIVVSFRRNIVGAYKWSVLNLAVIDFIYSATNILNGSSFKS